MLLVRNGQVMLRPPPRLELDDELIEQNFAQCVGRAMPPSDHTHRQVAVAGEGCLDEREIQSHGSEAKLAERHHPVNSRCSRRTQSTAVTRRLIRAKWRK